jgi:polar amino acid transport system substrate-binding protein
MFGVEAGDDAPDPYVDPGERDRIARKLAGGGRVENHELKMYDRERRIRDVLVTYLPLDYGGEDGILGWLLDITERKEAEKAIKEKFDELTRFRRLAVGREEKMIELKKEINDTLKECGFAEKYKIR